MGGPSGGILPADALDTPYEFEARRSAGAHMGSGSIVVVDERSCLVDLASVLTRFCADQACGKTIPCRIGLRRLAESRRPHLRRSAARRRDHPPDGPFRRHRGQPPVRPRTPLHAAPPEPRPVLPRRARRPYRTQHVPRRDLPADGSLSGAGPLPEASHARTRTSAPAPAPRSRAPAARLATPPVVAPGPLPVLPPAPPVKGLRPAADEKPDLERARPAAWTAVRTRRPRATR